LKWLKDQLEAADAEHLAQVCADIIVLYQATPHLAEVVELARKRLGN
jgi:hypothetical protein